MRPPSRRLAPGAGTACPPRLGHQGAAPGDQSPPLLPPPSPSGPRADGGRPKRQRPRTPPEEAATPGVRGAPRPRQAPQVNHPHGPARPAADRRRTGGAQDSANGAAPTEAGLGNAGARTRAAGFPPSLSPPAALTHWRPTGPRPAPEAAWQPPRHEYTPGGARRRQQVAGRRPTGRGGGGRLSGPPTPPPCPPPRSLRATGATLLPPGAEGTPPLPQKGPRRGGCGWTCTPRAPAPPATCSHGGRGRRASPHQRAGAACGPSLGVAHGGAPEQYGGRAPHDPPDDHCPLGEGREGVQV